MFWQENYTTGTLTEAGYQSFVKTERNVLGYQTIVWDKRTQSIQEYSKPGDPYSKVFVVSMPSSAIKNIPGEEAFLDAVYQQLKEYGLNRHEAFVYYLFDRDRQSNKREAVESKISLLRNPLDNGMELPGALLLSYPCVQAYYCQAHDDPKEFANSQEAKAYANANSYKQLTQENLCLAAGNMEAALSKIRGKNLVLDELEDYGQINQEVYRFEESYWQEHEHRYLTLSLLSLSLLDLGVIEVD